MSAGSRAKAIVGRSPAAMGLVRRLRRLVGADDRLNEHEIHLASLDVAIGDIFPALQEVQGPILSDIERRLGQIEMHLPQLLNTIASANGERRALRREFTQAQVQQWERTEMIRREIMNELRYGPEHRPVRSVEPKILDDEKLAQARAAGLRLNLGCGHIALEGYVNVDSRDLPGVDVIAPVDALPCEAEGAHEVFSAHLIEHFPQEQVARDLLPYWISLLRPGGTFRAVVPDAGAMLAAYEQGDVTFEELREVLFGGQEYEGDFHFNMYTVESFSALLESAGLVEVSVEDQGRRNGTCFEFQIAARKPG